MVIINHISFAYKKKKWIYKDFTVKFETGRCTALIGHNGVGKTTLFKLMIGLLKPEKGNIIYKTNENISKKDIGYVPDFNGFFSGLSVYENIKFRQMFCKNSNESTMKDILKIFGLEKYKDEKVRDLSNGFKKRVALASVLISTPKYLLMDEPTNGLDPQTREVIISIINKLKDQGVTVIFSSHDLNFVYRLSDDFYVLNNGAVTKKGKCSEYCENDFNKDYFMYTEGKDGIKSITI